MSRSAEIRLSIFPCVRLSVYLYRTKQMPAKKCVAQRVSFPSLKSSVPCSTPRSASFDPGRSSSRRSRRNHRPGRFGKAEKRSVPCKPEGRAASSRAVIQAARRVCGGMTPCGLSGGSDAELTLWRCRKGREGPFSRDPARQFRSENRRLLRSPSKPACRQAQAGGW